MTAVETALIAVGLAGLIGYLAWTLAARRAAEARAEDVARIAQLEATVAAAEGQEQALEDRMAALSSRMAEQQRKDFLDIAEERFKRLQSEAEKDAKANITAMEELVKPMKETLAGLDTATKDLEEKRMKAIAGVEEQIRDLAEKSTHLGKEADRLSTALSRSSRARGDWGEVALRRILEMANMTAHADFTEQAKTKTGRPDVIVHVPGDGVIPIDSKVTAEHYLAALDEEDPRKKTELLAAHARSLRDKVKELKTKDYRDGIEDKAQFVVMFVPSEALVHAAYDQDPNLHEYAMTQNVVIVSPASLLALLRTAALYWKQVTFAEEASLVVATVQEFYKRMATWSSHFALVGRQLESATKSYNKSVGSWDGSVLPQARKLEELRVSQNLPKQIEDLSEIETMPREPRELE